MAGYTNFNYNNHCGMYKMLHHRLHASAKFKSTQEHFVGHTLCIMNNNIMIIMTSIKNQLLINLWSILRINSIIIIIIIMYYNYYNYNNNNYV